MSQPTRILLALVVGLVVGIVLAGQAPTTAAAIADYTDPIGTAWLNALRMTIVPLVVGLLVTGIAATAKAARASRLAGYAILAFMVILWLSAIVGALATPLLLDLWPIPAAAAEALRSSFAAAGSVGEMPPFSEFLAAIVPTNPLAAAANDAFMPMIVFVLVFAFAVTRLPEAQRTTLTSFFQALADAMLIVIHWVLWLAPIGVGALAYGVGARTGAAAFGALAHYIAIVSVTGLVVWLCAYPLAVFGGRAPLGRFVRAIVPPQAVALSTQSSLASLPAMLGSAERLGVPVATSGVVLPLAVAMFRSTGPAMNMAVAIYVAHIFGMELSATQLAIGVAVAATTTLGAVSLPGTVSFVSSIAPIAIAMGVPIEPLAILIAVETLPDIVRTLGNVTMDVAVTDAISERTGGNDTPRSEADALLER